jgi:hypothetical protein
MKNKDIKVGETKVVLPNGKTDVVKSTRLAETGKRGRPATLFVVAGAEYTAKELKAVEA